MEKVSTHTPSSVVVVDDGKSDRKAITKVEIATAKIKDIPLDPVNINYPKSNLYPTPFTVEM